jgi:ABC-type antimicrobial peptide transport system permease subunit
MASVLVIFKLALSTLWENKVRSLLTLVGMLFGNAAVIATLSSNDGAQKYIAKQLESLGNKLLTIDLASVKVTTSDVHMVARYADEVESAVRELNYGPGILRYNSRVVDSNIWAVDLDYFDTVNLAFDQGRNFLQSEFNDADFVAVVGSSLRKDLFGRNSFVDQEVILIIEQRKLVIRIIGSLKEKGGAQAELDRGIYLSPHLMQKIYQTEPRSSKLVAFLKDDKRSTVAKYQVKSLLYPKFGNALRIADAREAIERTQNIWSKQNFVGICLAAISLITGGVGIMNIMLLSIHQRQKEIGLRKAVGAQNSEIAVQFLLETVMICLVGGCLGVLFGWGFGHQVAKMLGDWEAELSLTSIFVALSFSVVTGIIFGALPAMRASRIDPYDALRTG